MKHIIFAISAVLLFNGFASAQSIVDTKHNLSVSGPGTIKATKEEEICIFCHTPHFANRTIPYLWNKENFHTNYDTYQSSTIYATVGQPTGSSKLCLSCHDGTIALGAQMSKPPGAVQRPEIEFQGGIRFMPDGPTKLGTDLRNDHPISFTYDSNLASNNTEIVDPSILPVEIQLDGNSQLQCTSCHNPHGTAYEKFLVLPNINAGLCISCHQKSGWGITSHSTSGATWNGQGNDPWFHTPYTTVAANGCENCHSPHNAGSTERLFNYAFEEDNCLVCHNGNVASTDIDAEFSKPYTHPVGNYVDVHDAAEDYTGSVQKHVECIDCHNPHWANSSSSPGAPLVSGKNQGVKGISTTGQSVVPAVNLYEICYKCHGNITNNVKSTYPVDRVIPQLDVSLEFSSSNPSRHPVVAAGANPNVPSLIPPLNESSVIFCTDCHNNSNTSGPQGPHGSNNPYLFVRNYTMQDNVNFTESAYALCFGCHYWDAGNNGDLRDEVTFLHKRHMENADASCFICHDPHGISSTQGNSTNNSHLINFNLSIVSPNGTGPAYTDTGNTSGSCNLVCHGETHNNRSYDCPC